MNIRPILAIAIVLAFGLGACGSSSSKPDPAACETAMAAQLASAQTNPGPSPSSRPAQCAGLSDAQLQTIGTKVMNQAVEQGFASAFPTSTP